MARFLIGTIPVIGHINPIAPVARELVSRGHQVQWYTGDQFRMKVEATGSTWRPMKRTKTYGVQGMDAYPERDALEGVERVKWDIENVFIPDAAKQADDFADILVDFPADAILCDTMFLGPRFLYERGNAPPWAKFNITVLGLPDTAGDAPPLGLGLLPGQGSVARARNRSLHWMAENVVFRQIHQKYRDARVAYGLSEGDGLLHDVMSPFLWLQNTVPSFEYPYAGMPPQVHFIGAVAPEFEGRFAVPDWWHEVEQKTRPVILITQGTIATNTDELIKPAIRALADEDVLVVVTTAGSELAGPLPSNVRVANFLPYDKLLPYVDAMVVSGSYGTVQYGLYHGVPMVASGETEDKIEVCARVEWSGAGVRVKGTPPKEAQIRSAVRRVLIEPTYRTAVQRIQSELRAHDAPKEAATLLEALARTKAPVIAPT